MELAAEADLAVSEPESVVSPQAAEDRAAPERGPRGATAPQREAGQEPSSQGKGTFTYILDDKMKWTSHANESIH